ncbi:MAG: hypothetical protein GY749_08025 [Desulfobacteraceae bacterium]|nr:hypothetical protein [Desulfobacteraceae bacterium]
MDSLTRKSFEIAIEFLRDHEEIFGQWLEDTHNIESSEAGLIIEEIEDIGNESKN